jgi:hypothetical protein
MAVYPPSRRESKVVTDIDGELVVVKQLDNQARPLVRPDRNRPIRLSNITDGCLRAWWEVVCDEADGVERAPCARIRISVNGIIDRRDSGGGRVGEREVVNSPELTRLSRLGYPGKRGRLEGANEGFDLKARAWTDVSAFS